MRGRRTLDEPGLEPDGPISFAAGDAKLTFDLFAFDGGSFTVVE